MKVEPIELTDNIPRTALRIREVQQLAGGPGSFLRIIGMASDQLEATIRAGIFDAAQAANMLGRSLGGQWQVHVAPRPGTGNRILDVIAEQVGR